jgi:hypothetical protein
MKQQFDNLPHEGCVPDHNVFNDLSLSPLAVDDSFGYLNIFIGFLTYAFQMGMCRPKDRPIPQVC